jgi:type IV pilus assembly protein PilE
MTTIGSATLSRPRRARARRAAGFTLIETLVTIGIAAVLSSIAYPGLEGQVLRARRADALVALLQGQLAQERFRASNPSYGSLDEAGLRPTSPAGHYRIDVVANSASGYELLAGAVAAQARDARCRYLRLAVVDASLTYASGSDTTTSNAADVNRLCWSR